MLDVCLYKCAVCYLSFSKLGRISSERETLLISAEAHRTDRNPSIGLESSLPEEFTVIKYRESNDHRSSDIATSNERNRESRERSMRSQDGSTSNPCSAVPRGPLTFAIIPKNCPYHPLITGKISIHNVSGRISPCKFNTVNVIHRSRPVRLLPPREEIGRDRFNESTIELINRSKQQERNYFITYITVARRDPASLVGTQTGVHDGSVSKTDQHEKHCCKKKHIVRLVEEATNILTNVQIMAAIARSHAAILTAVRTALQREDRTNGRSVARTRSRVSLGKITR